MEPIQPYCGMLTDVGLAALGPPLVAVLWRSVLAPKTSVYIERQLDFAANPRILRAYRRWEPQRETSQENPALSVPKSLSEKDLCFECRFRPRIVPDVVNHQRVAVPGVEPPVRSSSRIGTGGPFGRRSFSTCRGCGCRDSWRSSGSRPP